jgi:hypothetical protein
MQMKEKLCLTGLLLGANHGRVTTNPKQTVPQCNGKVLLMAKRVETEVQKWLTQQSKDFYSVGFDTLVKRWNKCINVGGGHAEK